MNGKENIIQRILDDADKKCAQIIDDAKAYASKVIAGANTFADDEQRKLACRIDEQKKQMDGSAIINAQLQARKYKLDCKQKLIASCYDKAMQVIAGYKSSERLNFLHKLIEKYAESGETVVICKCDKDIVTQKWLDSFGKNLKLSTNLLDEQGGILLEKDTYTKNLTLARLIQIAKQETEGAVSSALFE